MRPLRENHEDPESFFGVSARLMVIMAVLSIGFATVMEMDVSYRSDDPELLRDLKTRIRYFREEVSSLARKAVNGVEDGAKNWLAQWN